MVNKAQEVISESIRRLIDEVEQDIEFSDLPPLPLGCPFPEEYMKRMAALNIAMSRIIESAALN